MHRLAASVLAALLLPPLALADAARQEDIARRGAEVMPFDLEQTRHVFSKTGDGGVQQVFAQPSAEPGQAALIRRHLQELAEKFRRGDFSGPARIHGGQMPGLARLRQAGPALQIDYRELENGAELRYASAQPDIVQAVHDWFDAQLADHGRHAMPGHHSHHGQ